MRLSPTLLLCLAALAFSTTAPAASRCTESQALGLATLSCTSKTLRFTGNPGDTRPVVYEVPLGTPPVGGWPVVFIYQPLFSEVKFTRSALPLYESPVTEVRVIKSLLDNGFAVLAPAAANVVTSWDTNNAVTANNYAASNDFVFLGKLFNQVGSASTWQSSPGRFVRLNPNRMYATGLSSGGYNTSRMAVSFPGRFRALAIESASYATCGGAYCSLPKTFPAKHPPTLFLHGSADLVVPLSTMLPYEAALQARGVRTRKLIQAGKGHEWIDSAPYEVVNWFLGHP